MNLDMNQPWLLKARDWLESVQHDDGGWGERCNTYDDPVFKGQGPSTASQTAWAVMGLCAFDDPGPPEPRARHRISDPHAEPGRLVDRGRNHRHGFPEGVLSQIRHVSQRLAAAGAGHLPENPGAGRLPEWPRERGRFQRRRSADSGPKSRRAERVHPSAPRTPRIRFQFPSTSLCIETSGVSWLYRHLIRPAVVHAGRRENSRSHPADAGLGQPHPSWSATRCARFSRAGIAGGTVSACVFPIRSDSPPAWTRRAAAVPAWAATRLRLHANWAA